MSWEAVCRRRLESMLAEAGVEINGAQPWDIQVSRPDWFSRVAWGGSLALGESYMEGWWECPALDQFFHRLLRAGLDQGSPGWLRRWAGAVGACLFNRQSLARAGQVAHRHYDLGNDLFMAMLDQGMNYSCAHWEGAEDLDKAQENKLALICQKLGLQPGMRLLDIGCGWGGLARHAAQRHGAEVLGVTISRPQAELAAQRCAGLPVEIRLQDYRQVEGKFDRLVSVGMFEHVGYKNYRLFMQKAAACLDDEGLFLLHTIGGNTTTVTCDPWIQTYIFPNGMLPSPKRVAAAAEDLFVLEDWHSFGEHYDQTLLAWRRNFLAAWEGLASRYDQCFFRMWNYYLLSCAGAFRARAIQLWQMVFSKRGLEGGYRRLSRPQPCGQGSLLAEVPPVCWTPR
ncbi:MAG: cyclopropane fatty acyl phospholipid synthase [Pseudomonadota bacterium]